MYVYINNKVGYNKVSIADGFFKRFVGLMWKKSLDSEEGLWITKCNQVHMFNMRFPLDIVYLDKENKVVKVETLKPREVGKLVKGAYAVLEVTAGSAVAHGVTPGDYLEIKKG